MVRKLFKRSILTNIFKSGGRKWREVTLKIGGDEVGYSLAPLGSPRDIENMKWAKRSRAEAKKRRKS